jgi:hypothetical protein
MNGLDSALDQLRQPLEELQAEQQGIQQKTAGKAENGQPLVANGLRLPGFMENTKAAPHRLFG